MAPEEVEKPIEAKPEEPKAEAAAPVEEATPTETVEATVAEPAEAAQAAPPADPAKQLGDAAGQVGASVDKAMAGVAPENRVIIVAVLSIIVGGWLGSIFNGQVMKGVAILVVAFCLAIMGPFTLGLSWLLLGLVHVLAAIDAIIIASRIVKGEKFGDWDFFIKPAPPAA